MLVVSLLMSCAVLALTSGQASNVQPRYPFIYEEGLCSRLPPSQRCCTSRQDDCSTPISTTRCYCDSFCNKHGPNQDCCKDYVDLCERPTYGEGICPYGGISHNIGARVLLRDNCYSCICKNVASDKTELQCEYTCPSTPGDVCPYNNIDYPARGYVTIEDRCYTCTCQRSWNGYMGRITMNCLNICPPVLPPVNYVCHQDDRFWIENETVRENCRICTCRKDANGVFGVSCLADPVCEPSRCYHDNRYWNEYETVRENCRICTCQKAANGVIGVSCSTDHDCDPKICHYNSQVYPLGHRVRMGLQECTCTELANGDVQFTCHGTNPYPNDIVTRINSGSYGWTAYRYSFLVGHTMEEIFRLRTGVCRPETHLIVYNSQLPEAVSRTISFQRDTFDARTQWPGLVRPISDAGNHPISWAITIADLTADRRAIHSIGKENLHLSAQNLISCVRHPDSHCTSTAKGWEYLSQYGIVSDQCYPRSSQGANTCQVDMAEHSKSTSCPSGAGYSELVRLPHANRISTGENVIRGEIGNYGPVQAHIRVKEDFFYYRSGVYKHVYDNLQDNREYYLAVRIIGWGTDVSAGSPIKYWICANSWGKDWGENGYFRILRGKNECQIEDYVFAVSSY